MHVYVPWSVVLWIFSMVNEPLETRCHIFVGNLTLSTYIGCGKNSNEDENIASMKLNVHTKINSNKKTYFFPI